MEKSIQEVTEGYREEFKADLAALVACESVRETEHRKAGAPFGAGIGEAFQVFLNIAKRLGFEGENIDGYACEVRIGDNQNKQNQEADIAVLGHLDVVEAGNRKLWETEPFCLTEKKGVWYGRGVNDDKGPLLACLYAARILEDRGIHWKRPVRIIAGGAEETTWECMEYYFQKRKQPFMGFSPDGNFPIVNGEKGIIKYELFFPQKEESTSTKKDGVQHYAKEIQYEIRCSTLKNYVCDRVEVIKREGEQESTGIFKGKRSLSRNPQRGEHAIWEFARWILETEKQKSREKLPKSFLRFGVFMQECLIGDYDGKKSGLYAEDKEMGSTSLCPTGVVWEDAGMRLFLDMRYPKSITGEALTHKLTILGASYGFEVKVTEEKKLLYVEPESELVCKLKQAYEEVMGEKAETFTKAGASYARVLERGVAFGASFPGEDPHPHMPNERISINSLLKAMEIYVRALELLAG